MRISDCSSDVCSSDLFDACRSLTAAFIEQVSRRRDAPFLWRSWDGLEIVPGDYFANVLAANAFNERYDLDKIGKPTDRYEWHMTPQTVNAYYSSGTNTNNFPAAILQPPFFYADGDDAINYGGIGAVIGHEAGHGIEDKGSQFEGAANNANWWTKRSEERRVGKE